MNLEPRMEKELRDALRALTPREAVKIKVDPVRYMRMAQAASAGAETELSPEGVHYLTILMRYIDTHGPEGVSELVARWRR